MATVKYDDDPDARRYLRHGGHLGHSTVADVDGNLYCAFRVTGQFAQLAPAASVLRNLDTDDKMRQGMSNPGVEFWSHAVRMPGRSMRRLPPVGTWAGDRMDRAYAEQPAHKALFENVLYRTVVQRRPRGIARTARSLFTPKQRFVRVPAAFEREFDDLTRRVEQGLGRYGVRRLGLVEADNGALFSETFEAWHQAANCASMPCGVTADPMGRLIVPHRPVFGDAHSPEGCFLGEDGSRRFFAVLTYLRYPARTRPVMFDDLMELSFGLVITHAERFELRQSAIDRMQRKMNQKESVRGAGAAKQLVSMGEEQEDIELGDSVPVRHHCKIVVYGDSIEEVNANAGRVVNVMAEQGVTLHRQREALKAAFYATIVGNFDASPASAPTKSRHSAAMATPNGVSPGRERGRWGAPVLVLRTTLDTEYPLHLHIPASPDVDEGDRGNIRVQGPPGTGKTVLVNSLINGTLRVPNGRVFCVDNRLGMSINVEANGGSYAVLRPGQPCCALLRSLDDTPENRTHIKSILLGAILRDGQGSITSLESDRLGRGIARQMRMAPHERSLWGVHAMLPSRKREGRDNAADRLKPWCRGQALGWALDAEEDGLDLSARLSGCDTTLLMKDKVACGPVLSAILYRVAAQVNGDPFLLVIDEAWQIELLPELEEVVGHALATIRKDEGVVILATQMGETYAKGKLAAAYRNQVPTSIWFADADADRHALAHDHHLSEAEIEVVTELLPIMPRCFLLKRPGESVLCRFDLSGAPQVLAVLSARRSLYRLMRAMQAQHGPRPEAWLPPYERLAPGVAADPIGDRDWENEDWDKDLAGDRSVLMEAAE